VFPSNEKTWSTIKLARVFFFKSFAVSEWGLPHNEFRLKWPISRNPVLQRRNKKQTDTGLVSSRRHDWPTRSCCDHNTESITRLFSEGVSVENIMQVCIRMGNDRIMITILDIESTGCWKHTLTAAHLHFRLTWGTSTALKSHWMQFRLPGRDIFLASMKVLRQFLSLILYLFGAYYVDIMRRLY